MVERKETFDIIRLKADSKRYYPASMGRQSWMKDNAVAHTDIEILLGHSRYGGPVIDLPRGVAHPGDLKFAAQLDLSKISPHDPLGLLPMQGQLYFFADIRRDKGKVIFADVRNDDLVRQIVEHEDDFFEGTLIVDASSETETLDERFREPEDESEKEYAGANGLLWDNFAGGKKSKVYGIYTHCQYSMERIMDITHSDRVLLLQIGEDFNDEGIFSVLIPREDLRRRNFDDCEFDWGQS
jgi:uncharacterized protein YwqG